MDHNQQRRDTLKYLIAGAGAMATGGLGRAALAQQDTIRIAAIYPLSGPLAQFGNGMLNGARIAAEQFNRAGGLLGKKVEVIARDDKASPAESALVAREVLGTGVHFIVGGLLTAPGMAIVNLLQENNALFLLTGSQVMSLTHENFNPNAFRPGMSGRMSQFAVAEAMPIAVPNITKWGGITPDNQFGTDNNRITMLALKKAYKAKLKKDIEISDPVLVPFPATDFKVQITRLMSSPVEGIYTGMVGADYFTFMAQAKALGLFNKIKVFIDAGQGLALPKGLGSNLPKNNLWSATPWYPQAKDANAVSKALVTDYTAMTKDNNPDSSVFSGHTGMLCMLNAIKNAKSLEPAVVRVALERVEFEAASGPFRFRHEDHQGLLPITVFEIKQKAGDPGWEVGHVVKVKGEDVVEPAAPGQKYVET